ncbi:MAG: hypothetical protein LUI06_04575 [Ruminococcus sp.]|nr:hypothetical protein [Ruminococcus sp.]
MLENINNDYSISLDEEIENRIKTMEQQDYKFAQKFAKNDYILLIIVVIVCLVGVIGGAFIK